MVAPELLAQPLRLGGKELRNRLVLTPHLGRLPAHRLVRYVAERAAGGVAMAVLPAGQGVYISPNYPQEICEALDQAPSDLDGVAFHPRDERHRTGTLAGVHDPLARLAGAVQGHGAIAVGQIHHPGAEQSWDNLQPAVAPSPLRADATGTMPHPLSRQEIRDLIHGYAATAAGIVAAGMDGVELHAAHGYLLNRFLSPHYNRRTDAYGGDRPARLRLLREILAEIRARVGPEPLLGVRLPVAEQVDGGLTPAEVAGIAATIAPMVSYLSLTLGNQHGVRDGRPATAYTAPWLVGPAPAAAAARQIRAAAGRPVLVTGRVTTAATARALLREGAADLVGLARALIADPLFARRATTGAADRIVECIGCNECVRTPFACPVNPAAGREGQLVATPARGRERVVVVGAGPAGVAAATAAAERGYEVTVLEAAEEVGGAVRTMVHSPLLAGWAPLVRGLRHRIRDSRVGLRLGTPATGELLASLDPAVVVLATGAEPLPAGFPADRPTMSTMDLLAGTRPPAGPVVVVGGAEPHLEPLLAADLLASGGWPVVLLTERHAAGADVEPRTLHALLARLFAHGVTIVPMMKAVGWSGGRLATVHCYGDHHGEIEAATVVTAHGRGAVDGLAAAVPAGARGYLVGDALAPRRLSHAVLEGTRFGLAL